MACLLTLPPELQLRIFEHVAVNIDFAIPPTPPDNPTPTRPFAFSMGILPRVHNHVIYNNTLSAVLTHILTRATCIRFYVKDMNFDNATLLFRALNARGRIASFTNTETAGETQLAPCQMQFFYTNTKKFPKGGAKLKAFSKFVESLMPTAGAHLRASNSVMECESLKVMEEFSLKFASVGGTFGRHFDLAVRAVRKELKEDLAKEEAEQERENARMMDIARDEGWTDGDQASEVADEYYDSDSDEDEDPLERMLAARGLSHDS